MKTCLSRSLAALAEHFFLSICKTKKMTEEIVLSFKKIQFADANSNKGGLNFGSNAFYASSLVNVQGGVVVEGNDVGASSNFTGAADLGDVSNENLSLIGSTSSNTLTIQADPSVTSYNLVLPSTLGTSGEFLKNNGSGILSFSPLVTGYANNQAWIFGTTKQLWSAPFNDPLILAQQDIPPVAPFKYSGFGDLLHKQPFIYEDNGNRELILFNNRPKGMTIFSWDQGTSSEYWDMRFDLRMDLTDNVYGGFYLFGNDTLEDVTSQGENVLPTGGLPSDSTGIGVNVMCAVSGNNFPVYIYENGVVTATLSNFSNMTNLVLHQFRVQRKGRRLRFEICLGPNQHNIAPLVYEKTLESGTNPTGTRWGISMFGAADIPFNSFVLRSTYIECRAVD